MKQYLFIFGNHPVLSLLELKTVAETVGEKIEIKEIIPTVVEVTCAKPLKIDWWQNRLGGTIKIAEKVAIKNENQLADCLKELCLPQTDKFVFGISLYNDVKIDRNKLGMTLKRYLIDQGIKVRFVVGQEKILSSVIVKKNKLLSAGSEFILVKSGNEVVVAVTITVQDFEGYSGRDYGRPAADAKNGMLPPKLAKIMVNLAKVNNNSTILDPFCGSGTVLQEALLMGVKKVKASDLSERAVKNTKINIDWLAKKDNDLDLTSVEINTANALELSSNHLKNSIDAIITEPYLGPVDRSNVVSKQDAVVNELEKTYRLFIKQATEVVIPGGRIVIVVPIIMGKVFNYKQAIVENKLTEIFPAKYSIEEAKYSRTQQRVERLIVVAQKQ